MRRALPTNDTHWYDALDPQNISSGVRQLGLLWGKFQVHTFTFPDYGESKMSYHVRRKGRQQHKAKPRRQSLQKPSGVNRCATPAFRSPIRFWANYGAFISSMGPLWMSCCLTWKLLWSNYLITLATMKRKSSQTSWSSTRAAVEAPVSSATCCRLSWLA